MSGPPRTGSIRQTAPGHYEARVTPGGYPYSKRFRAEHAEFDAAAWPADLRTRHARGMQEPPKKAKAMEPASPGRTVGEALEAFLTSIRGMVAELQWGHDLSL